MAMEKLTKGRGRESVDTHGRTEQKREERERGEREREERERLCVDLVFGERKWASERLPTAAGGR